MPICGDGNCFFSAISRFTTACKELPHGTDEKHNELRQKTCDLIVQHREKKDSLIYKKMMDRETPLVGNQLDAYIKQKRATTGQLYTWSDSITFEAMAAMLNRPIMQLTYPVYI